MIFDHPDRVAHRRHGPAGYSGYQSFLPWLRDEFAFRCVYCLKREQWGQITGEFDIDHFRPQAVAADKAGDYGNLVYACRRCNSTKCNKQTADPFFVMTRDEIQILADGTLSGATAEARRMILLLDLNSPRLITWRLTWLRIVELAKERDRELWRSLTGFPPDLPDLARLRPPGGNDRPEGVNESWASVKLRGELPESY